VGRISIAFCLDADHLKPGSVPIKSLLITGATGFVGSHVVEAFAGRAPTIRALVRSRNRPHNLAQYDVEPVTGSLEDADSIGRAVEGADVIVHMAAATRAGSAAEFTRVNGEGTRAVVDAIRRSHKPPRRLVYLSSLAAVGPARNGQPVGAGSTPAPLTAYGHSKLAGERHCAELNGICEVVILRPPAVYGPRDRDLYEFFRIASVMGLVPVPSGPGRPLQMVHVSDLARAVVQAAATQSPVGGVYHIADSRSYLWEEVGCLVAESVGRRPRPVRIPAALIELVGAISEGVSKVAGKPSILNRDKTRELLAPGWLCETEAARNKLGFEAEIPLDRGLKETADWYRAHGWL
jgi:nucleoside-diphosphate-sugar epimerase